MSEIQKHTQSPAKVQRDLVIDKLKAHFAKDNLHLEEFEERLHVALTTKSSSELESLVSDLPDIKLDDNKQTYELNSYYDINQGKIAENNAFINIFSGTVKKGVWIPPRNLHTLNIFGGAVLDFRKAKLPPGTTTINAVCIFGGLDITIPPGVNIEGSGIGIFGGFENRNSGVEYPGAPTIKINGIALFGGVSIRVKKDKRKE